MWPNPQLPADLLTFTDEILNGKLHFLCGVTSKPTPNASSKHDEFPICILFGQTYFEKNLNKNIIP